ncbi:HAMP domain-containing histidine kinase [Spirochaetales bacterium NM-380-WT-3C1]|uniref:histidine kinase n=1 Tax=Bullifex porci TaxID=2606638 RepID=A0A7X2TQP7_9SPIO|nr:HAMP domain-containing sensor histidine kinase [Bullifex porci]MSU06709.1 HAMP domain-containing histidine kinase [Bullifex porci]
MNKGHIRHYFLRLFFPIFLLSIFIIALQLLFIYASNKHAMNTWPKYAAGEYVKRIKEELSTYDNPTPDRMINTILECADDRISGLIFRDAKGLFQIIYGTLPNGDKVKNSINDPSMINSQLMVNSIANLDISSMREINTDIDLYEFNVDRQADGTFIFYVNEEVASIEQKYTVPLEVQARDIAASVVIKSNGEVKGYYDILVMTARKYGPTRYILDTSALVIVTFLPIAVIVSLLISYVISKRNEKSIKQIQTSLKKLSNNEFDVEIGSQKSMELQSISDSIVELGNNLRRHQDSRKEWIRSISHDLNTPLTSLNMLLDASIDGIFPINADLLKQMKKECDVLTSRISAIKYYAFLLSPDCKANKEEVGSFDFVDSVISQFKDSKKVDVHLDNNSPLVLDTNLASRALCEVLNNAIQSGSDQIDLYVSDSIITIKNKGKLPDPLPDFFEPWARGDLSRHEGGSGLGLPITGQIMNLHGGKATISQEGEYVVVTLSFK